MKKKIIIAVVLLGLIVIASACYVIQQRKKSPVSYKPNIYLYPEVITKIDVDLSFPQGGEVIKSIPNYDKGWQVEVSPLGKIAAQYDYLFYESKQPDHWQYKTGWVIEQSQLKSFFESNMAAYGFNTNEINDFIVYWIPRLKSAKYYQIFPQEEAIITELVRLNLSEKPDNLLRVFYRIKEIDREQKLEKHVMPTKLKREGFVVCEWGVLM